MSQIGWFNNTYQEVDIGGIPESVKVFALIELLENFSDTNGFYSPIFGVIGPFTTVTFSIAYVGQPDLAPIFDSAPRAGPYSSGINVQGGGYVEFSGPVYIEITAVVDGVPAANSLWLAATPNYGWYAFSTYGYTLLGSSAFWTIHVGTRET